MENNKKKLPKYVKVYNQILKLISDGIYVAGEKLPSEPDFAEQLGVSRVTLRQALVLLKEDGIITAQHGSGNYISKEQNITKVGLEVNDNPIYSLCTYKLSLPTTDWELRASTEFVATIFQRESPICLVTKRYYLDEDRINRAFSMNYILSDVIEDHIGKLTTKSIEQFLNKDCYQLAHKTKINIQFNADSKSALEGNLHSTAKQFISMAERIYDNTGKMLVYTKSYLALEDAEIFLNR